jgi:citrate lyase synthetase
MDRSFVEKNMEEERAGVNANPFALGKSFLVE